ncbi:ThuA domain-containing protein [Actinoplanes sp. N902-109]|uniref:ThuA domain-containing protein n=1 Tax=Actinoplanes sp. (strain N902-109) TaxID=649831 RepID=UPI0005A2FF5E|nr:ThuA domain-containing protein [Actinoplanes sp. N902-109]
MRALVVRGGWDGHEPVATTDLITAFLASRGFGVTVAETLAVYEDQRALTAADLIVQCWTGGELTEAQEHNLVERVRAGAGLAGWHGGILATAPAARHYQYLVGGRFLAHPGDFVDYEVTVTGDHPVVAGVGSFSVHTEQYYCHVDPTLEVLATTTFTGDHGAPETAGATMPVVWLRRFGRGRVFVSTLGHGVADLLVPQARTITERGLLWAAGAG